MPAIIKFNGDDFDILCLSGIDYGEKCLGDHRNIWSVGCVYGVTLGQSVSGWNKFLKTGDPFADPCIVHCGIWSKKHPPPLIPPLPPSSPPPPPPQEKCPKGYYRTREEAVGHVRETVRPRDCFVWEDGWGKCRWRVVPGTGCAHWVSHQLDLKGGRPGKNGCHEGFLIRVDDILKGRKEVDFGKAQPGDLWWIRRDDGSKHIGIIREVKTNGEGKVIEILVEHDSDSETGKGKGVINSWYKSGNIVEGRKTHKGRI